MERRVSGISEDVFGISVKVASSVESCHMLVLVYFRFLGSDSRVSVQVPRCMITLLSTCHLRQ
jgi:hypothetical protein